MLDEFAPKPEPQAPILTSSNPGVADIADEGVSDEDFAKQLQAGMADLLGELETSPDMQAQFESMLKELGGAAAHGGATEAITSPSTSKETTKAAAGSSNAAAEESFQETIKKTMERMQASGASATAAASSTGEEDLLAEMMKAMGGMDGEGSEEDFSKMLLGMMEQLTNKEILYEPMKELHDKYPDWMAKNEGKVPAADMSRYKEQRIYVEEIVGRFERKGYSDDNVQDREYIVERMQKVSYFSNHHLARGLTFCRCKLLGHHLLISLVQWKLPRKHLEHPRKAAPHNKNNVGVNRFYTSDMTCPILLPIISVLDLIPYAPPAFPNNAYANLISITGSTKCQSIHLRMDSQGGCV
jgi:peroxin-19